MKKTLKFAGLTLLLWVALVWGATAQLQDIRQGGGGGGGGGSATNAVVKISLEDTPVVQPALEVNFWPGNNTDIFITNRAGVADVRIDTTAATADGWTNWPKTAFLSTNVAGYAGVTAVLGHANKPYTNFTTALAAIPNDGMVFVLAGDHAVEGTIRTNNVIPTGGAVMTGFNKHIRGEGPTRSILRPTSYGSVITTYGLTNFSICDLAIVGTLTTISNHKAMAVHTKGTNRNGRIENVHIITSPNHGVGGDIAEDRVDHMEILRTEFVLGGDLDTGFGFGGADGNAVALAGSDWLVQNCIFRTNLVGVGIWGGTDPTVVQENIRIIDNLFEGTVVSSVRAYGATRNVNHLTIAGNFFLGGRVPDERPFDVTVTNTLVASEISIGSANWLKIQGNYIFGNRGSTNQPFNNAHGIQVFDNYPSLYPEITGNTVVWCKGEGIYLQDLASSGWIDSPLVANNVVVSNGNSGITLFGVTNATVRGNVSRWNEQINSAHANYWLRRGSDTVFSDNLSIGGAPDLLIDATSTNSIISNNRLDTITDSSTTTRYDGQRHGSNSMFSATRPLNVGANRIMGTDGATNVIPVDLSGLNYSGGVLTVTGGGGSAGTAVIITNIANGGLLDATPAAVGTNVLWIITPVCPTNIYVINQPEGIPIRLNIYGSPPNTVTMNLAASNYIGGDIVAPYTNGLSEVEYWRHGSVSNVIVRTAALGMSYVEGPVAGSSTNYATRTMIVTNVPGHVATSGTTNSTRIPMFRGKTGTTNQFVTLEAGANTTITDQGTNILIASSGGGGSGGIPSLNGSGTNTTFHGVISSGDQSDIGTGGAPFGSGFFQDLWLGGPDGWYTVINGGTNRSASNAMWVPSTNGLAGQVRTTHADGHEYWSTVTGAPLDWDTLTSTNWLHGTNELFARVYENEDPKRVSIQNIRDRVINGVETFYGEDYGIKVYDNVDDAAAMNAIVTAVMGGANTNRAFHRKIKLPAGKINMAGAMTDVTGANAMVCFPLKAQTSFSAAELYSVLEIEGSSPGPWDEGTNIGSSHSTNGTIISITSTNEGWVFASHVPGGGLGYWNLTEVRFKNISFQYETNSGSHACAVDLWNIPNTRVWDCTFRALSGHGGLTISPMTNTVALRLPRYNNGNLVDVRNVTFSGWGFGLIAGEHVNLDNAMFSGCRVGIGQTTANWPNFGTHLQFYACSNDLVELGPATWAIDGWKTERIGTGTSWRSNELQIASSGGLKISVRGMKILDDNSPTHNNRPRVSSLNAATDISFAEQPGKHISVSTGPILDRGEYWARYSENQIGPSYSLIKGRGTPGYPTVPNSGDLTGAYSWGVFDGVKDHPASGIYAEVLGTVSTDKGSNRVHIAIGTNLATAIVKQTWATAGTGIGTNDPQATLHVMGSAAIGFPIQATNATAGFLHLSGMTNRPGATPTTITGYIPMVISTNDGKIWIYNAGQWVSFTPGAGGGSGTPSGDSGAIQFADTGMFTNDTAFTFDSTNNVLKVLNTWISSATILSQTPFLNLGTVNNITWRINGDNLEPYVTGVSSLGASDKYLFGAYIEAPFLAPGQATATNQFWRVIDTATGQGEWATLPASGSGGGTNFYGIIVTNRALNIEQPLAYLDLTNVVLNAAAGNVFSITATNHIHLAAPTNLLAGHSFYIHVYQDAVGGWLTSYNTNYWKTSAGVYYGGTTNAGAWDIISCVVGRNGTNVAVVNSYDFR